MNHFAQGWRIESTPIFFIMCDKIASQIRLSYVHAYLQIFKLIITKDLAQMAVNASYPQKNMVPFNLLFAHRILVASIVSIIREISRDNRSFKSGYCF